jgi:hypothetical protein
MLTNVEVIDENDLYELNHYDYLENQLYYHDNEYDEQH